MIPGPRWRALAFGALWCASALAPVASAATHPCAEVVDDAERLACFDAAFERPARAVKPAPPVQPSAGTASAAKPALPAASSASAASAAKPAVPAQAAAPTTEDFGLTPYAKRSLDPDSARSEPASLTARVTDVARGRDTRFVVTLDNGQVWRQVETLSQARVSVGDTVTIREASLGSYLLVTTSRIATRVRRVR